MAKKGARELAQCAWGPRFDLQPYEVCTPNTRDEDKARSNWILLKKNAFISLKITQIFKLLQNK